MSLDREIFIEFNERLHNGLFDAILPNITNAHHYVWFWVVMLPLLWLLWARDGKRGRTVLALLVVMLPIVNTVSSNVIKPLFQRPRPSAVLYVNGQKESVVPGARLPLHWDPLGTSSFPSSHSAVTACAATILIWAFRKRTRLAWLALLLPLVIGYSRVYVGVHYPSDVLAGWTLGFTLTALVCALVTQEQKNTSSPPAAPETQKHREEDRETRRRGAGKKQTNRKDAKEAKKDN